MSDELRLPDYIASIPDALTFWAERTPDAPALRAIDGRTWSHAELHRAICQAVRRLSSLGIQHDACVALVLTPGVEASIALLSTMAIAIAAPLNPRSAPHELKRDLQRLAPQLLITGGPSAVSQDVATALKIPTIRVDNLLAGDVHTVGISDGLPHRDPNSIAVVLHTSGTTASPKRVPRPHRTYVAAARASRACTNLTPDDVELLMAALHNNQGVANLLAALFCGGSCVVASGFDPIAFPSWLADHQPTWFVATPTQIIMLLDGAAEAGRETIVGPESRLRVVRLGAQPLSPGTLERAEHSLRAHIFDGYGMTEASYITGSGPGVQDRRRGSCGPALNTEIRILDEGDRDLPCGEAGAIVIRGPTVFPGYLDDPEANAAAFLPGGWFRTGDLGHVDEDGFVYLHGRLNELINRGGEKIAPVEVDHALQSHPAVADAAVFAVPDVLLGEDLVAAVVLKPGMHVDRKSLRGWLLERVALFKVPSRIWLVEELPRTVMGKVQRRELARRWSEEHG